MECTPSSERHPEHRFGIGSHWEIVVTPGDEEMEKIRLFVTYPLGLAK